MTRGPATWTLRTLKTKTAQLFQEMIRAEAGALSAYVDAVDERGNVRLFHSPLGYCRCVTCGRQYPWRGNFLDAGHFVPGRRNSILFEETNVHPQCKGCNRNSGEPLRYELYMRTRYGQDEIDRLRRLNNESRKFSHDELVAMRNGFAARRRLAVKEIQQ